MSQCAKCGAEFSCGMADDGAQQPCWCTRLPPLTSIPASATCLCEHCLRAVLEETATPASGARDEPTDPH